MKIYKTVLCNELQLATSEGWALEGEPQKESRLVTIPGWNRNATAADIAQGRHGWVQEPDQKLLGKTLVFVVSKDFDTHVREEELLKREQAAINALNETHNERYKLQQEVERLTKELAATATRITRAEANETRAVDALTAARARQSTTEANMTKVRVAIGAVAMDKILGVTTNETVASSGVTKIDGKLGPGFTRGSIVVTTVGMSNIQISHSHTPSRRVEIEKADRRDLLCCLLEADGVEPDIIALIAVEQP